MTPDRRTLFISAFDVCRLIDLVGLSSFMERLSERIRKDFLRWPEFQKSARTANHSPGGVIELMPVSDKSHFSFKYVTGHPQNPLTGLPTIMGLGALSDFHNGWPLMICEMTLLTAIRTAATSVVAAKELANKDARSMAMIGNGAQSEFQILAFFNQLGITRANLFDTDPDATEKLISNLTRVKGLQLVRHDSVASAVANTHIVTTSTADKTRAQILTPEMIEPGMHVNAVGGDCPEKTELHPDILSKSKVFVEFEPQSRIEGEIQQMPPTFPVTELWQVLRGCQPGRTSASEVTVFDSVGFSIEDFSALTLVYELACTHGIGSELDLIPKLSNTKDLYGYLTSALSPGQ